MLPSALLVLGLAPALISAAVSEDQTRNIDIKMPNSHPENPETYLCTPTRLDPDNTNYIVGKENGAYL